MVSRTRLAGNCRAERAAHIDVALPYELRALEGALHVAVGALEADTLQLEQSIGTSLDNLDRRVLYRLTCLSPLPSLLSHPLLVHRV